MAPSVIKTDSKLVYALYVGSIDATAWVDNLQDDGLPGDLYVEIRQDGVAVRTTKAVKQNKHMWWNQEFLIVGNSSSNIGLSLVQNTSGPISQTSSVACVDVVIGTLLVPCLNDKFAVLEMTSKPAETKLPIMAVITVKFNERGHVNNVAMSLDGLGERHLQRFEHLGDLSDLQAAISNMAMAAEITDDAHPSKALRLLKLGNSQQTRFKRLRDLSDLDNAILNHIKAVELTNDRHPHQPIYLSYLSISQHTRFEQLEDLSDLEKSISNNQRAVELTADGHVDKAPYLMNLGNSHQIRFKRLGDLSDLENAISNKRRGVELTADGHLNKANRLFSLAISYHAQAEQFGNLSDLENSISNFQNAIELIPDGHPDQPSYLSNLGVSQHSRFMQLGNLSDLENAMSNERKAVELTHEGHPVYLSNLGISQHACFDLHGDLSDLENAVSNYQKAVELTADGHPNRSLYLSNLGSSQKARYERLGDLSDFENAISNHEEAVKLTPDKDRSKAGYLSNLGSSQHSRFRLLGHLSDLENAISNFQKAVELTADGHPGQPRYLSHLGVSQETRFERLGDLFDLENSLSNHNKAVELTADGHPSKTLRLSHLANSQEKRFERLGDLPDLENCLSNREKAAELTADGHPRKAAMLYNLGMSQETRFKRLSDLSDLENAISNCQKAVELPDQEQLDQPLYLVGLARCQQTRFERLRDLSDIENTISNMQKAVELTADTNPSKSMYLLRLGTALKCRFQYLNDLDDLAACVSFYKAAAQQKTAYPSHALHAARQWAQMSHSNGNLLSALDGYRMALDLLPKVAWLGLNISSRQDQLRQSKSENLGCLAANCAIQLGHLEEAVELLDLSRSIFWQQASSLRSDLEKLSEDAPQLAEELERLSHLLDAGTFSDTAFTSGMHEVEDGKHSTEHIGKERRRLVGEWEGLVERVRQLPQFEYFLQPTPFCQLRRASSGGQVVIINVSKFGVDGLIFSTSGAIEHVPLPDIHFEILTKLSSNIVLQKPVNASATQRRRYVTSILKPALRTVWSHILVHIFDRLHIPLVDSVVLPQCRIWWYLTGPLTFIPIHAGGSRTTDVSQLVISSYVTTLGSLFKAQTRSQRPSKGEPKLLCVCQTETPGQSLLPQTTEEVDRVSQVFRSSGWSEEDICCLQGSEATVDNASSALDSYFWVHFACHAFQDSAIGMKSAFALHDGYLELGHIASKNLSNGQFAFLSACEAAAGLQDLPGEAMHLAASFQFTGFPSVIATMWSIRDNDAPTVAEYTYRYLFRNGRQQLNPSEAATALNRAILRLREDPSITVDQWAPFIHFGI